MCFLSHLTNGELLGQEEAFCSLANVTTNELKSCYNFNMECTNEGFSVYVEASREFGGAIFPPNNPGCRIEVDNVQEFYYFVPYNDKYCGIQKGPHGYYETELQVQHSRPSITTPDFIFNAVWTCPPVDRPVTPVSQIPTRPTQPATQVSLLSCFLCPPAP